MEPKGVKRKLTTILAADVEGYSRLMSADEEATLKTLKSYREIIDSLITRHDGRIFGTAGDSVIAEFGSTVEAVRCAITIQEELRIENAELAEEHQMKFRIGVNVGDVMVEGDNLYGDGVNIAARLEGEAEAGGICISGSAFDQVKNKLSIGFEDIGPQQVKNIAEPVPAFRVVPGPVSIASTTTTASVTRRWRIPAIAAASVVIIAAGGVTGWQRWIERDVPTPVESELPDRAVLPLPDKPSIAVLPFHNLSGDSFAEVFLIDAAENVATALSRLPDMSAISGFPTLPYKDKPVDVQQVAEELDVRYVLTGSVKRSNDQVRITAKLIDTRSGRDLWAGVYNRDLKDASAVQEEITLNVVTALEVKLVEGAAARIVRGNTNNPEAYSLVQRGLSLFPVGTKAENVEARRLFEKAVELDPDYSIGWHLLGYTHNASTRSGWGEDLVVERARAEELARKALAIDPSASGPYILLSTISLLKLRFSEAVTHGEKAVVLAPNDALTVAHLGRTLILAFPSGRKKDVLPLMKRAIHLSPYTPPQILFFEGLTYHSVGRYQEEIREFNKLVFRRAAPPLALFAITSADLGRMAEARAATQEIPKVLTSFSAKGLVNSLDYKDQARSERAIATLRQLGLPE